MIAVSKQSLNHLTTIQKQHSHETTPIVSMTGQRSSLSFNDECPFKQHRITASEFLYRGEEESRRFAMYQESAFVSARDMPVYVVPDPE